MSQSKNNSSKKEKTFQVKGFGAIHDRAKNSLYIKLNSITNSIERIPILDSISEYHIKGGNTDSILHYSTIFHNEVLKLADSTTQQASLLLRAYEIISIGKRSKGLLDTAIKWNLEGIQLAEEFDNLKFLYIHKLDLGIVYLKKKDFEKANSLFQECLNAPNVSLVVQYSAYKYLGDIDLFNDRIDEAKTKYTKALDLCKQANDIKQELIVKIGLGTIAKINKNYDKALDYFEEVKDTALDHNYYDLNIDSQIRIGDIYLELNHIQSAELIFSTAYTNANFFDSLYYQEIVLYKLKDVYTLKKDYKNAYAIMSQINRITHLLTKNQNQKEIRNLEVKYETLQKENEIKFLKKDKELKNIELKREKSIQMIMVIAFLIMLVPIIILLYVYYQKLQTQHQLNTTLKKVSSQEISSLLKKQELKIMNAILDAQNQERKRIAQRLHDSIGGDLAGIKLSLSTYIEKDIKLASISSRINETYQQIRNISHNLIPKKFQNYAFTTLIEEYVIQLEESSDLSITFSPFPEYDLNHCPEDIQIEIYTILQELITNIIKHAKASTIEIHLNLINDTIQLLVEDNGIGFDGSKISKGIGHQNIDERAKALKGNFTIDSVINRGTTITIEVPIL